MHDPRATQRSGFPATIVMNLSELRAARRLRSESLALRVPLLATLEHGGVPIRVLRQSIALACRRRNLGEN